MHDLKSELEGYNSDDSDESHKKKALDALKRMEKWNLFSDTPEVYLFIPTFLILLQLTRTWNIKMYHFFNVTIALH